MRALHRVLVLGFLGWVTVYGGRTVLYPMLPFIADEFGLSSMITGTIVSAYFVTFALIQIPSGIIGARFGYKPTLALFFLMGSLALAAVALWADSYAWLLVLVALYGLGAGVYGTASWGVILQNVPARSRGTAASLVTPGMSIGLASGLILAGPIYLTSQNWRLPLLVMAFPAFLIALAYAALAPRSARESAAWFSNPLALLRDRQILLINLTAFLSLYTFNVVLTWGPTFLLTQRSMSVGQAGFYTGLVALGAVPGAVLAGWLSDRFGRRRVSLFQFPLTAVLVILLLLLDSPWLLALNLILYGLVGKLAWDPISIPWLRDHMTVKQADQFGAALGLFNLFAILGAVLAPTVSGWLRDVTGELDLAFYVAAGAVIIASVLISQTSESIPEASLSPSHV